MKEASTELNTQLGITGVVILAFACVFALILSRMVSKPFLAARDNMFLLGDSVVRRRRRGWPMGGTMSAIAAGIDLEDGIHLLYSDR